MVFCCGSKSRPAEPTKRRTPSNQVSGADSALPRLLGSRKPASTVRGDEKTGKTEDVAQSSSMLPSFLGGDGGPKPGNCAEMPPGKSKSASSEPCIVPTSLSSTDEPKGRGTADEAARSHSADSGNMLGALVEKAIASYDESMLGVKIRTESIKIEPISGSVEVHGLYVDNPKGYRSPYMLHAKKLLAKVSMMKLMTSLGSTIEITEIDLVDIDVIYEKSLWTSNINDLMKKLDDGKGQEKPQTTDETASSASDQKVILHKINVCNVGAKVCTNLSPMVGPRLAVGDICYEDFEKEAGGATGAMDVFKLVMATLLKSILASILGKRVTASASSVAGRASHGILGAVSGISHSARSLVSSTATSQAIVEEAETQPKWTFGNAMKCCDPAHSLCGERALGSEVTVGS